MRTLKTTHFRGVSEGGCRVGLTSILRSNSCPVNGWRLERGGKQHATLTLKEQKETLYAASDTCTRLVGPRGNSITCRLPLVSPEQTELPERTGQEKHTGVCSKLGFSVSAPCTLHTHANKIHNMPNSSLNLSSN